MWFSGCTKIKSDSWMPDSCFMLSFRVFTTLRAHIHEEAGCGGESQKHEFILACDTSFKAYWTCCMRPWGTEVFIFNRLFSTSWGWMGGWVGGIMHFNLGRAMSYSGFLHPPKKKKLQPKTQKISFPSKRFVMRMSHSTWHFRQVRWTMQMIPGISCSKPER